MKNPFNALVVLSAFAITTSAFAQTNSPPSGNYKQQNLLLSKKNTSNGLAQISLSNDYSTNPLANHRNYKTQSAEPQTKVMLVDVGSKDKHKHYKQKNLLTNNGHDAANRRNKADSILVMND